MNIMDMMRQAKEMQERLQQQMAEVRVEATAGGGMVTVVMNGAKQVQSIVIDPDRGVEGRRGDAAGYDRGRAQRRAAQGGRAPQPVDVRPDGRAEDPGAVVAGQTRPRP